jgi:PAS domain S-box-containing protein
MDANRTILCRGKRSQIAGLTPPAPSDTIPRMSDGTNGGRAEAFQALRESEELHRATLESISDAVFLTDDDGVFTFVCPNVDVIFGYAPDEVHAMTRISRLLGENLFDRAELSARGEINNIEREVISKAGERRSLLIHLKKVAIQRSTVLYTCRDVTERRHAEEELRAARLNLAHASRLALVGELLASLSHEINQPLTSILNNASAGLRGLTAGAPVQTEELGEIFGDIRDQGRRAGDVIERVRALAGKRPLELKALDMNQIAGEIVSLVRGEARRRGVTVRTELVPSLPAIGADRVSLQQVMLNLMLNGMDAMDHLDAPERQMVVSTRGLTNAVEVAVSDTGHGIPSDRLPRLFDAFFTTKKDGLGLGLAIARSIVEAHGGRIWAEDHGGRGATFRLAIPAVQLH